MEGHFKLSTGAKPLPSLQAVADVCPHICAVIDGVFKAEQYNEQTSAIISVVIVECDLTPRTIRSHVINQKTPSEFLVNTIPILVYFNWGMPHLQCCN